MALLVLSTSFGYFGLTQSNNDFYQFGKIVNEQVIIGRFQSNLLESRIAFKNFLKLGDASQQQVFEERFANMQTFIDEIKTTMVDENRAKSVNTILQKANEYKVGFKKVVEYKAQRDTLDNSLGFMGSEMDQDLSEMMQSAYEDQDVNIGVTK